MSEKTAAELEVLKGIRDALVELNLNIRVGTAVIAKFAKEGVTFDFKTAREIREKVLADEDRKQPVA